MTSRLNPYISFPDMQARPAMEFYQSVLGGELTVSTFGEFGMADTPFADGVMHAQLTSDLGFTLMGSDRMEGMPEVTDGDNITVSLSGDDREALRGYFEKLAEGGQVRMPLQVQMWGDEYGDLVDRFGIGWLVNIAGEGSASEGDAG